jgi:hypothetical protein
MRRPSRSSAKKISTDSQRLLTLAQAVSQSGSRLEERAWERSLDSALHKQLKASHQATIDEALDFLFKAELGAYDALMEAVEAVSESCVLEQDDLSYEALLIAAPILSWTRFSIASGPIAADTLITLSAQLSSHLLAANARLVIAPTLYSIDQLPRTHVETFALTQRLAQAALKNSPLRPHANVSETAPFLADTRYLLAIVIVPAGEPLFRWQETQNHLDYVTVRSSALNQWREQAMPSITRLLPGCGVELLLPEAYYTSCRGADEQIRPVSIRAAVHYLIHTLSLEPADLRAVIGRFGEQAEKGFIEEFRVGFTLRQSSEIVYGIVWPLYGQEDGDEEASNLPDEIRHDLTSSLSIFPASPSSIMQILATLREVGITHVKQHHDFFPLDYCDDCGAPLFADPEGELVHAEMPEDAPEGSGHFH